MTASVRPITVEIPLLETKFYRPQWSADLVSRSRLLDCIHPQRKLTLISAPAGFGKTTLLAEWVATVPNKRVAWVSLDQSDNDPAVFWSYLITALQKIQSGLGVRSLSLLQSPQLPPIESVLMTLLNEITATEADIVLILDDYHRVETPAIHRGIGFLLSHLPPQLHLIIASRADPPLSLARLRSHGELTELRVSDLRFTPDEATDFLNQGMGLAIAAADVAALEKRTEGWIAGLQLAALSLRGRENTSDFVATFSGDDRYIVDYLLEEVLQRQSDRVRHFLLQTAILDRLSGALCDAVTDQSGSQNMLETLERSNLFLIPLDNKRQWYRYHHLFADVLQAHAQMAWPECLPQLHGRASEWYEQHELFPEAIRHTLAAEDFERAAGLIEQVWPSMRQRQQETTVLGWLEALPDSLICDRPILSVVYALVLLHKGRLETVEARLQDAELGLAQLAGQAGQDAAAQATPQTGANKALYRSLPASIANARAYLAQAQGDFASTVTYAQQALALLSTDDEYERGTTAAFLGLAYWANGNVKAGYRSFAEGLRLFQALGGVEIAIAATFVLGNMGMAQGWLRATVKTCEQALQLAAQQREQPLQGTAELYVALSEIRCEQGDLTAASQLLQTGESLREQISIAGADCMWWLVKAQLTAAQGNLDAALEQLHEAEQRYGRSPIPNVRPIEALKVRWWLRQGRLTEALDWMRDCGLSVDDEPSYLREYEHLTLARVAMAQRHSERSIAQYRRNGTDEVIRPVINLLNRLLAAAEAQDRTGSMIKVLVVLALAREAQGDIAVARVALERSLVLAEPEGYVRLFVDEGEPMRRLLRQVVAGSDYGQRLLAAFGKGVSGPVAAVPVEGAGYVEPLTPREVEVLRLIAAGMRNQEIAEQLFISLATVKRHIANAYGKLGVSHRMEAVVRANELNWL